MIGGGFLGGGISIVPAGKAIIYASMTTEDGENIPNAVFKAVRTGSTVTANGGVDGRAELLVDAGHTYTVTVTPAGGSYLNRSQTVATASAKSYAVKFYLYPAKANEASTTASLNALNTSISTHVGKKDNPHAVTKAQVGLGSYPASPADIGISTATQTALDGTVKKTGDTMTGSLSIQSNTGIPLFIRTDVSYPFRIGSDTTGERLFELYRPSADTRRLHVIGANSAHRWELGEDDIVYTGTHRLGANPPADDNSLSLTSCRWVNSNILNQVAGVVNYVDGEVGTHEARKDNPHSVTKSQVGLGNVNNTSDLAKPISTATQNALDGTVKKTGNEEISGIKTFNDPFSQKSTLAIGGAGYKERVVNRLLDIYNNEIFADIITNEADKRTIRKTRIVNADGNSVFNVVLDDVVHANGTYTEHVTTPNGAAAQYRHLNPDGTGYSSTPYMPYSQANNFHVLTKGHVADILAPKQDKFSLYEHTIRVWTTVAPDKFRFSLTVLNQSPTEFSLPNLHSYLGGSADDYKQCSGMTLTASSEVIHLTGVRGGAPNQLFFEGVNEVTGAVVNAVLDWMAVEVLHADKVRQIV